MSAHAGPRGEPGKETVEGAGIVGTPRSEQTCTGLVPERAATRMVLGSVTLQESTAGLYFERR